MVNDFFNNVVIKKYPDQHYYTLFNKRTGLFIRCEDEGYEEPFWTESGPELLDISITNWCDKQCEFCYRDSSVTGTFMDLEEFDKLLKQASRLGVFQVAIGGGNPNQHPHFTTMLEMCRKKYGIVPSYTTNGKGISDDIIKATQEYCGAVAVSAYYPYDELDQVINKLISNNIKTNVHFLLTNKSIDTAIEWLKQIPQFLARINALIFLNYKPVGSKANEVLIANKNERLVEFLNLVSKNQYPFKIGFDSCSISGVVKYVNSERVFLEACEAGRFSAFISENSKMYPCSFMVNKIEGIDLWKHSIADAWRNSIEFLKIRDNIKNNRCRNICKHESICMGGCPVFCNTSLCLEDMNKGL